MTHVDITASVHDRHTFPAGDADEGARLAEMGDRLLQIQVLQLGTLEKLLELSIVEHRPPRLEIRLARGEAHNRDGVPLVRERLLVR